MSKQEFYKAITDLIAATERVKAVYNLIVETKFYLTESGTKVFFALNEAEEDIHNASDELRKELEKCI